MRLVILINLTILFHSNFSYSKSEFKVKQYLEMHGKKLVDLSTSNGVFDSLNANMTNYNKVYWCKISKDLAFFALMDSLTNDKKYFIENKNESCFYQSVFFLNIVIPQIVSYSDLVQFSEAWVRFNYQEKSVIDISRFALGSDMQNIVVKKRLIVKGNENYLIHEKVLVKRFSYFNSNLKFSKLKRTHLKVVSSSSDLYLINKEGIKPLDFRLGYQILFW